MSFHVTNILGAGFISDQFNVCFFIHQIQSNSKDFFFLLILIEVPYAIIFSLILYVFVNDLYSRI